MVKTEKYRGYVIEAHLRLGVIVKKDGKLVVTQPSFEAAYDFIDAERENEKPTRNSDDQP